MTNNPKLNKGVRAMMQGRGTSSNRSLLDYNLDRVVKFFNKNYSIKVSVSLDVLQNRET